MKEREREKKNAIERRHHGNPNTLAGERRERFGSRIKIQAESKRDEGKKGARLIAVGWMDREEIARLIDIERKFR